jgi:ankyrin repeat protein
MSTDDTMRPSALRQMLLIVLAGLAGPGCAKEDLLMHKADVHEVFTDTRVAELADAIADNDAQRVHALAKTTDLRARGDKNVTLLEWAVFNQSKSAFAALLDEGADPSLPGIDRSTVAHLAAMANDRYYLDQLLERGVDPSLRDQATGQPLLSAALVGRREEQLQALLAADADINGMDEMGNTPLHQAALINDAEHALVLLKAGANPAARNAQDASFQTYLFMGREDLLSEKGRRDREAVRAWLQEHGVEVEASSR